MSAVLPSLIAACASLIVAVVSVVITTRTTRRVADLSGEVERQKLVMAGELAEQKAVRDARRDYEYEAKKRLYGECEPLIFQAVELAELGRRRIASLARTCRQQNLRPDGGGWLSSPGYYFQSTTYFLFAPMTSVKILQQRLTAVDLSLELRLEKQYELLKLLFAAFTEDHALAAASAPPLPYEPDRADPGEPGRKALLRRAPATYRRQGLYQGRLEMVTEAFIKEETFDGRSRARCKRFGEFQAEWHAKGTEINALQPEMLDLFRGFHPQSLPALWRVLSAQYLLYSAFLRLDRFPQEAEQPTRALLRAPSTAQVTELDWRHARDQAGDEVIRQPLEVAYRFLRAKLSA